MTGRADTHRRPPPPATPHPALTSQAPQAGRGVGPGGQRAVVGRGGAEQNVVGQGLVQY